MITFDGEFTVSLDESEQAGEEPFTIEVSGADSTLTIDLSDPSRLPPGERGRLRELAGFADSLAQEHGTVRITGPDGLIIEFGEVRSGPLGRMLSGSSHIRLGTTTVLSGLGLRSSSRGRLLPSIAPMLHPLLPMIRRGYRMRVTTTHYARGAGRPRLYFTPDSDVWDGTAPGSFELAAESVLIGSGPECDLILAGTAARHAEIRHDADDEYVLFPLAAVGGGAQDPTIEAQTGRILRSGSRLSIGGWRVAFFREEFAEHGRPYGGRQGGELSQQRRQPPRSEFLGQQPRQSHH